MAKNRAKCPTRGELVELYGWWERNRDKHDSYTAMEFASMAGRLFAHIERGDPELRDAFLAQENAPTK